MNTCLTISILIAFNCELPNDLERLFVGILHSPRQGCTGPWCPEWRTQPVPGPTTMKTRSGSHPWEGWTRSWYALPLQVPKVSYQIPTWFLPSCIIHTCGSKLPLRSGGRSLKTEFKAGTINISLHFKIQPSSLQKCGFPYQQYFPVKIQLYRKQNWKDAYLTFN